MNKFSTLTKEALLCYVYLYIDPRDSKLFYVGKGEGDRAFSHLNNRLIENHPDKTALLNEIIDEGLTPKIVIACDGLSSNEAFIVERVYLDICQTNFFDTSGFEKLTNKVGGHHSKRNGIRKVEMVEAQYSKSTIEKEEFTDGLTLLVTIAQSYERGSDLYDAARMSWALNPSKLDNIKYVMPIYGGVIRDIFKPAVWHQGESISSKYTRHKWWFDGERVLNSEIREKYIGRKFKKTKGCINPIQYIGT